MKEAEAMPPIGFSITTEDNEDLWVHAGVDAQN